MLFSSLTKPRAAALPGHASAHVVLVLCSPAHPLTASCWGRARPDVIFLYVMQNIEKTREALRIYTEFAALEVVTLLFNW